MIGSDEGIKLGSTDVKLIGNILGNVDGITLGLDVGTHLGSLYGSLVGSNDGSIEGLEFHWDILMVKFLALTKASKWYYFIVECLELYL